MPRTSGSRNRNYRSKENAMVLSAIEHGLAVFPQMPSMRSMAAHADVSLTNFRHYFPSEKDVRTAVLNRLESRHRKRVLPYLNLGKESPRNGLCALLRQFYDDWKAGVGKEMALAMSYASFSAEPELQSQASFKPYLDAFGQCLTQYMKRRQLRKGNADQAALMLLAPALLRLQTHQWIDRDDTWVEMHVSAFLKGWW